MTWPALLLHSTPCATGNSRGLSTSPADRFAGSSNIPDLKDSSAALSDAKQLRLLNSAALAMKVADVVAAAVATSKKQSAAAWCQKVEGCRILAIVMVF